MKNYLLLSLLLCSLIFLVSCDDKSAVVDSEQPVYAWLTHTNYTFDTANWRATKNFSYQVTLKNIGTGPATFINTQIELKDSISLRYSKSHRWFNTSGDTSSGYLILQPNQSATQTFTDTLSFRTPTIYWNLSYFGNPYNNRY